MTLDNPSPPPKPETSELVSGAVSSCSDLLDVRLSRQNSLFKDGRLLVWFSCGAASACALKLVAHLKPLALYCNTLRDEHTDNLRFLKDVQKWTGIKINTLSSTEYTTTDDVFEKRQYMSGHAGAPCTVELKKVPRLNFQWADDTHIFGYTAEETKRIANFEANNPDMNLAWPLRDRGLSKADCLQMVTDAGIEIPAMYRLGFENNNCWGCVKATSPHYWNLTRKHNPKRFRQRAEQSRRLGAKLVRYKGERIYLDELPEDATEKIIEDLSCGPQCGETRTSNAGTQPPPG